MKRPAGIFAALLAVGCASPEAPTGAASQSAPVAVADASLGECPQRTETLYTPPLPEPGFVSRPPPGASISTPQRLNAGRPDYPAGSQRCREQGSVAITYCVSPEGKVENAQVVTSSGFARLDNAMLAWAARDRHTPAMVNGQPRRYCGLTTTQVFAPEAALDSSPAR